MPMKKRTRNKIRKVIQATVPLATHVINARKDDKKAIKKPISSKSKMAKKPRRGKDNSGYTRKVNEPY